MNKNPTETREFMKEFNKLYEENKNKINSNIFYGIAAPATNLAMLKITSNDCLVVAQNVNENESGSHTGEISINMVKSVGAGAVILGHSERRKMYNETSQKVSQKAQKVIEAGLIPIIAFGETFEEYKMGKTKEVIKKMIKESTKGVNLLQVILAYEPV
jgi:triosephosphate isomerase